MLVVVALVMAAMMLAMAGPAMGKNSGNQPPGPPFYTGKEGQPQPGGDTTTVSHCNTDPSLQGVNVSNKQAERIGDRGTPSSREVC